MKNCFGPYKHHYTIQAVYTNWPTCNTDDDGYQNSTILFSDHFCTLITLHPPDWFKIQLLNRTPLSTIVTEKPWNPMWKAIVSITWSDDMFEPIHKHLTNCKSEQSSNNYNNKKHKRCVNKFQLNFYETFRTGYNWS